MAIESLPEICMTSCVELWEKAMATNSTYGAYDVYNPTAHVDEWSPCDHENTSLEFSHEGLQVLDKTPKRIYSVVDLCLGEDCGDEYGEQSYVFNCPNN